MEEVAKLGSSAVAISVFVILISALGWRVFQFGWLKPKRVEKMLKEQGLFANSYKFLIGDLKIRHEMRKRAASSPMTNFSHDYFPRIEPLMHHTIKTHGNNSFVWMGPQPLVFVTEPELIREIFSRPDDFEKPNFMFMKLITPGLPCYEGDKYSKARKVVNPIFQQDKIKLMEPAFYRSCQYMIDTWDKKMSETGILELDLCPEFRRVTGDAISRAAFTSTFEEGKLIFELTNEQVCLVGNNLDLICIPGWTYLPTKTYKRMMKIDQQLDNLISDKVCKRMREMESGIEVKKDDMLTLLLESNKQCQNSLTTDEVVQHCKLFYSAGQDTISTLLTWTMILLSKYQDWQNQLREEIINTFGSSKPNYKGLNGLKKVNMLLYEVLRLYPPVSFEGRVVNKECKLGKLTLPTNTLVYFSIAFTHHNPDLWGKDASDFNPERFSEGIPKATTGKPSFIPFGFGPRACIGQSAAMLEVKMVLTMILQRFSFELSSSYSHAPSQTILLRPQFGAQIVLRPL